MEQSEFQLVSFENQPSKGGRSVPDALILSSCRLLVETKIKKNTVRADQLKRHLQQLDRGTEATQNLLVLTPDKMTPNAVSEIDDKRLVWSSFSALDQAIEELLGDDQEVVSEREAFLLRELQAMLLEERLIGSVNDVVVVPARIAWSEYNRYHAYVCQANRSFRLVERVAFYSEGQIQPKVPRIIETLPSVLFERGKHSGWLGKLVNAMIKDVTRKWEGNSYMVVRLSAPDDPETVTLDQAVINDIESSSGRTAAFTQNQRYVSLDSLKKAKVTSELVEG
jgi:hypothetical protein